MCGQAAVGQDDRGAVRGDDDHRVELPVEAVERELRMNFVAVVER
jgi:hypothetical protein